MSTRLTALVRIMAGRTYRLSRRTGQGHRPSTRGVVGTWPPVSHYHAGKACLCPGTYHKDQIRVRRGWAALGSRVARGPSVRT
jgi:hypothetical protein